MEIARPRKRRGRLLLLLILAVLLGIGTVFAFYPREPALLDRATPIVKTETWIQTYGGYFWRSDSAILAFRPFGSSLTALYVDTRTGQESPLMGLTAGWNRQQASEVAGWRLSPDGSLLIWKDTGASGNTANPSSAGTPPPPRWVASTLGGSTRKTWKAAPNSNFGPLWYADNRRWIETVRNGNGQGVQPILHRLDGPDIRLTSIQGPFTWPLAVTPEERLLSLEWQERLGRVSLFEYPLRTDSAPSVVASIPLPPGMSGLVEAELSPQGDRIACLVDFVKISPLESLLRRYFPDIAPRIQDRMALWIFRRDGKESRILGVESGRSASGLLWSPDGKHISLYDHDTLYSIPTE